MVAWYGGRQERKSKVFAINSGERAINTHISTQVLVLDRSSISKIILYNYDYELFLTKDERWITSRLHLVLRDRYRHSELHRLLASHHLHLHLADTHLQVVCARQANTSLKDTPHYLVSLHQRHCIESSTTTSPRRRKSSAFPRPTTLHSKTPISESRINEYKLSS